MRDIGKNLKNLRERKGLKQEELAEELFVTRQTISNYENGRSRPDIEMLMRIAESWRQTSTAFYMVRLYRRIKRESENHWLFL